VVFLMSTNMLLYMYMMPLLEQPGCPICRVRNMAETRYLGNLLHEYVNDLETRVHIIASLGYCPKHAWQMGLMEREKDGEATGNSIIYEDLVSVVLNLLLQYEREYKARKHKIKPWFFNIPNGLRGQPVDPPDEPYGPMIKNKCRVCQIGENNEENYLELMLEDFSQSESRLRDKYLQSDGLCLFHLRQSLKLKKPALQNGVHFLVEHRLETLPKLCQDLRNYTDKHAWNRHTEEMTPDERVAWIRAIRFFAGNEGNLLLQDLAGIPADDRENKSTTRKYD